MDRTYQRYQTRNIEQAAAIKTITGIDPSVSIDATTGLATFNFPQTPEVSHVVMNYESGVSVDARSVLNTRNQLFRRVKGGRKI